MLAIQGHLQLGAVLTLGSFGTLAPNSVLNVSNNAAQVVVTGFLTAKAALLHAPVGVGSPTTASLQVMPEGTFVLAPSSGTTVMNLPDVTVLPLGTFTVN